MSLEYGFGLYDRGTAEKDKLWTDLFNARIKTELDKNFYHNHLCWLLMAVDIRKVTKESIPHILSRAKVMDERMYKEVYNVAKQAGYEGGLSAELYLERFIGYTVNVYTTTSSEFLGKLVKRMKRDLIPLTAKNRDSIGKVPPVEELVKGVQA